MSGSPDVFWLECTIACQLQSQHKVWLWLMADMLSKCQQMTVKTIAANQNYSMWSTTYFAIPQLSPIENVEFT